MLLETFFILFLYSFLTFSQRNIFTVSGSQGPTTSHIKKLNVTKTMIPLHLFKDFMVRQYI